MKHLYIIGNGFDQHHNIPSSYSNFKRWLEDYDNDTFYKVENILETSDPKWWNEFETSLGKPFAVKLYAEGVAFENQPDYASDDYRDRDLYVAEYEVDRELGDLVSDLKRDFQEWASGLSAGDGGHAVKIETKDSVFLTFNYTLTLEKMYGISPERVLHIHGSALDKDSIVVGHGNDYGSFRNGLEDDLPEPPDDLPAEEYERWFEDVASQYSDDYPTSQAKDAAVTAMMELHKDVPGIIADNQAFFQSLKDVRMIHIYGFSFADVDIPYMLEVAKNVDIRQVSLEVSYFTESDKENVKNFLDAIPKPKSFSLVKLNEIKKYKQLELF